MSTAGLQICFKGGSSTYRVYQNPKGGEVGIYRYETSGGPEIQESTDTALLTSAVNVLKTFNQAYTNYIASKTE